VPHAPPLVTVLLEGSSCFLSLPELFVFVVPLTVCSIFVLI